MTGTTRQQVEPPKVTSGTRASAYADRQEAGEVLAESLREWFESDVQTDSANEQGEVAGEVKLANVGASLIVLGLPRGGVPVAEVVADALGAPLDVLVVRKLGVPRQPELAMGALASTGDTIVRVENPDIMEYVRSRGIGDAEIDHIEATEIAELRRRQASYRPGLPDLDLTDRTAVLVDDGLATGATVHAAIGAAREAGAARVVVALPVIVGDVPGHLREAADEIVCPWIARSLPAVGAAYRSFTQTDDEEVREILRRNRDRDVVAQ